MQNEQMNNTAMVFLQQNFDQHLSGNRHQLFSRCVAHLQERWDIPTQKAKRISATALAEIESAGIATVDIDASTSSAIVLRDPRTKDVFSISAAAIMNGRALDAIQISGH